MISKLRGLAIALLIKVLAIGNMSAMAADDVVAQRTTFDEVEQRLVEWVDQHESQILDELKVHVEINTGTANIAGLDRYRGLLSQELEALGFSTSEFSSDNIPVLSCAGGEVEIANHLLGQRRGDSANKKLLLNGHMDTVFDADDEYQSLSIESDGQLKGPGVADMKGGIVIMLNALRALDSKGLLAGSNVTVLFNSDEEIGSLGSRALIEEQARLHDLGLVFEGSYQNRVTRARKGLGQARLKVTGRESHAGGAHEDGVSANLELAHKIIAIEKLTDYASQSTVNTGVISGGEKRNTIAGCADAFIDLRFSGLEQGQELQNKIAEIATQQFVSNPNHPGVPTTEVWSTLHRPAKPQNDAVDELIAQAMGISMALGDPIVGTRYAGGGTDGSIAQAVGLPTIDSLGIDGVGAHSSREAASVKSLISRTKLAAILIYRLLQSSGNTASE